jgi:hypothetical protein
MFDYPAIKSIDLCIAVLPMHALKYFCRTIRFANPQVFSAAKLTSHPCGRPDPQRRFEQTGLTERLSSAAMPN